MKNTTINLETDVSLLLICPHADKTADSVHYLELSQSLISEVIGEGN